MKTKKILSWLCAVVMAFGTMSISAFAAENVATVETAEELQAALDNFNVGTTIRLVEDVDYGVVYLRPSEENPATKEVDWIGNNYRYETVTVFEDLTIEGAEGATIDAIEIEGGTYYNTAHSQADKYPVMLSLIELKNVVIDGVTFTGEGGYDPQGYGNVLNFSEQHIKVDGLTVKNCVLNNADDNARLMYKVGSTTYVHSYAYNETEYTFVPTFADIVVEDCTFNGGYMGLELRETNNITIAGNTFNGVSSRDILLPVNVGCTYSGEIKIIENTSDGAGERFVRASGIGNAALIIENNAINNYKGKDSDFIKAEGATGTCSIAGNTFDGAEVVFEADGSTYTVSVPAAAAVAEANGTTYSTLADAIAAGGDVKLLTNIEITESITIASGAEVTLDLAGFKLSYTTDVAGEAMINNKGSLTIDDSIGDGAISLIYSGAPDTAYAKGNYTISNYGSFTLKNGTIKVAAKDVAEETKFPHALYAIHSYAGNTTISGGKVVNMNNVAIRLFSAATAANFKMEGGEIIGTRAIWMQLAGNVATTAPEMNVEITDGTLTSWATAENNADSGSSLAIYSYSYGNDMKNVTVDISGGTFNGDVALTGGNNKTNIETVSISGGTFIGLEGGVVSYGADALAAEAITITGGTFNSNEAAKYAEDDGYVFADNGNGTYGVVKENTPPNADVTVMKPLTLAAGDYSVWDGGLSTGTTDRPLEIVMNFKANENLEQATAGGYGKWVTDFYLTVSGMSGNSITADNCYLAGNYGEFGWIVIPTDGLVLENGTSYPVVGAYDANLTYEDICGSVKNFTAAIHIDQAILDANPDMEVKLELKMKNPNDDTDILVIGEPAIYDVEDLTAKEEEEEKTLKTKGYSIKGRTPRYENGQIVALELALFAGIDSKAYASVGFEITYNGEKKEKEDGVVYSAIRTKDAEGKTIEIKPSDLNIEGGNNQYLFGMILELPAAADNKDILYRPFATEYDGTKIYGPMYKVSDIYPQTTREE